MKRRRDKSTVVGWGSCRLERAVPAMMPKCDLGHAIENRISLRVSALYQAFSPCFRRPTPRISMQLRRYHKAGRMGLHAGALVRYSRIEGEPFVGGSYATYDAGLCRPLDPVGYSRVGAEVVFGLRGFLQIRQIKGRVFWSVNLHLGRF